MEEAAKSPFLTPIPEESSLATSEPMNSLCHSRDLSETCASLSFSLDDTPIQPVIDGKKLKTFEDLVNEALKKDCAYSDPVVSTRPKQPFLRKGSGLKRFCSPLKQPDQSPNPRSCRKNLSELFENNSKPVTKKIERVIRRPESAQMSCSIASPESISVKKVTLKIAPQKLQTRRTSLRETLRRSVSDRQPEKPQVRPRSCIETGRVTNKKNGSKEIVSQYSQNYHFINRKQSNQKLPVVSREPVISQQESEKQKNVFHSSLIEDCAEENRLEVLQRLLKTIRAKQEELHRGLEKNHRSSEDESELTTTSDGESVDSSSLSYLARIEALRDKRKKHSVSKIADRMTQSLDGEIIPLSIPRLNSTIELKDKIESLEKRLKDLNIKCQKELSKSTHFPEIDGKASPQNILREMETIKKQLNLLNDKLDILETNLIKRNVSSAKNSPKSGIPRAHVKVIRKSSEQVQKIDQLKVGSPILLDDGGQVVKTAENDIVYTYKNGTRLITHPDGTKVTVFPSGQREKIAPDGTKEIMYINGSLRIIRPDGSDETITADGTKIKITVDGTETVETPSGDKEIRTDKYKRREYKDGTVKILFADGTIETRYPNGKVRIKNRDGKSINGSKPTRAKQVA